MLAKTRKEMRFGKKHCRNNKHSHSDEIRFLRGSLTLTEQYKIYTGIITEIVRKTQIQTGLKSQSTYVKHRFL